jgi:hypothetical protein
LIIYWKNGLFVSSSQNDVFSLSIISVDKYA